MSNQLSPVVVVADEQHEGRPLSLYSISDDELHELITSHAHLNDINAEVDVGGTVHYWYELVDELRWREVNE